VAAVGLPQPLDYLQRRCLAGTVRPQDAEELARLNLERHSVDGVNVAVPLANLLDHDGRRHWLTLASGDDEICPRSRRPWGGSSLSRRAPWVLPPPARRSATTVQDPRKSPILDGCGRHGATNIQDCSTGGILDGSATPASHPPHFSPTGRRDGRRVPRKSSG